MIRHESFPPRLLFGWLAAAALVFGCSFYFMNRDNSGLNEPDMVGPSTNSKSAIGYAAAYRMLDKLGVPVAQGHYNLVSRGRAGNLVVMAEPSPNLSVLTAVRARLSLPKVLLILPKRRGRADRHRPEFLGTDELVPEEHLQRVLQIVDPMATVTSSWPIQAWTANVRVSEPPHIRHPQLIRSKRLRPLLATADGMLVGEIVDGDRHLIVLSDPDIIANHGLGQGENAALVFHLIQALRGGSGQVVFDESIHGFAGPPEHSARILFEWPFALVTVQIAIAGVLLIWAAAGRFGAPRTLAPPLGIGKASLIESGSRLLVSGGHMRFLTQRYFEAVVRDSVQRLRGPRSTRLNVMIDWLAETGRRPLNPIGPFQGNDPGAALAAAREVHAWRRQVLDESGQHSKRR